MKKYIIILTVLLESAFYLCAQSLTPAVVASGGDYFASSEASLSFTIGEMATQNFLSDSLYLTQGFQQTFRISTLVESPVGSPDIKVYPVPATYFLNVQFEANEDIDHVVTLYDMQGTQILRQEVHASMVKLDLHTLPAAGYVLQISERKGMFLKSFMIVKE